MKLSDELKQYLSDPRFEQVLALASKSKPTMGDISVDTEPQKVNNHGFTQKGWEAHERALRKLINPTAKSASHEVPVTYGE